MVEQYSLRDSVREQRMIIERLVNIAPGELSEIVQGTFAESWLDAKQRFGFTLSAAQQLIFDRQQNDPWAGHVIDRRPV